MGQITRINISPEYNCYSLWISVNNQIYQNVNSFELEISDLLKERITLWEEKYELTFDVDNPINSGFKTNEEEVEFENEGIELCKLLKLELINIEISFNGIYLDC